MLPNAMFLLELLTDTQESIAAGQQATMQITGTLPMLILSHRNLIYRKPPLFDSFSLWLMFADTSIHSDNHSP